MNSFQPVYLGNQSLLEQPKQINEDFCEREGEVFYKIGNFQDMEPFFMTVTSDSNHWMFISSTGGLTAGRVNSESSLFPYYTDDRITENNRNTGPRTIVLVEKEGKTSLWEPFREEGARVYKLQLNLYRNVRGNRLIFEEINENLGLTFSYMWMNSRRFGWIRKSILTNQNNEKVNVKLTDGLMNIIPAGTSSQIQNKFANLLNAYKKSEIDRETGLGIFALSATLTDLAEPSESLKANIFWQWGLEPSYHLLKDKQLESISIGKIPETEWINKGDRGSYFVGSSFSLDSGESKTWYFAGDVDKDHSSIIEIKTLLLDKNFDGAVEIEKDSSRGSRNLDSILTRNDGMQKSASLMNCAHHQANVLYNIMRGGYFFNANKIPVKDLVDFVGSANKEIKTRYGSELLTLGEEVEYGVLQDFVHSKNNLDLRRVWYEYLPLTFSRRHGDPSRPWNIFSIETEKENGSPKLDYQGNWRDIFQNWEALSYSYPLFIRHMVGKFLNATTADGYNPYRISRSGIDWEVPDPGNPWANIGYWSDHQIIYLLKLLEIYRNFFGDRILIDLSSREFSYAEVPYEIKSFDDILADPYNTILFNEQKHNAILARVEKIGAEGKMLYSAEGKIVQATMTEKLMVLLLTKLGNFIPGGGIWMNTQRPEWNDANNALVGKGLSIVTLAYVRRFTAFLKKLFSSAQKDKSFTLNSDVEKWFRSVYNVLSEISGKEEELTASDRLDIVSRLGRVSEAYRTSLYRGERSLTEVVLSGKELVSFFDKALICIDKTLKENKRDDDLYHSYNTWEISKNGLKIHHLYEMLEGQVAVLSATYLKAEEAVKTLKALRKSALYREDQHSYMLYPDRILPGFLDKNNIDPGKASKIELFTKLINEDNRELISRDVMGYYHFNGEFHNVRQVRDVLDRIQRFSKFSEYVDQEGEKIEKLFEETFNHQSFTGRSGTFFAYEGLGSIYWHMVSKLLLAVQENLFMAIDKGESKELIEALKKHYYDVRAGIGYNKPGRVYGAFPFDPYSHTPSGKGAKQPGMTGQVKEEVITRLAETGIRIVEGKIAFNSILIDDRELMREQSEWKIPLPGGRYKIITVPENSLALTFCQTPIVIEKGTSASIDIYFSHGGKATVSGSLLPEEYCTPIYSRDMSISHLKVTI